MSTNFSTDDAYDGTYASLEKRCFQEKIDYDKVTSKSIRLRGWQDTAIDRVKQRSGTNRVQVVYSAYLQGLTNVRDVVAVGRINDLADLRENTREVMFSFEHDSMTVPEKADMCYEGDIEDPLQHHGNVGEPMNARFKDSAVSEVDDTFTVDAQFEGWIHRTIVSVGLCSAESIPSGLMEMAKEARRAVDGAYDKSRIREEGVLRNYISKNVVYWCENGIKRKQAELLREAVNKMETDHKRKCEIDMGVLRDKAEVIDDEQ